MSIKIIVSLLTSAVLSFASADEIKRTSSGKPDLSGNYNIANLTPFERDPKYGDILNMSPEEAAEIERTMSTFVANSSQDSDPDRSAPPAGGDGSGGPSGAVGGYNTFWLELGTKTYAVDGKFRTSIITDPVNGRLPAISTSGKARRATLHPYSYKNTGDAWWLASGDDPYDGPENLSLLDRCLYVGVATVPMRSVPYNNVKTIIQTRDHVVILVEWMHWARVIRLDNEHLPDEIRSFGGDSIGWWEGDTLVVDTTNFLEKPNEPREGLKVVERFTRTSTDTLLYQFTVTDPDYTAPYSGEFTWPQSNDRLFEYACHEGNYAMGNILRGARLLERETLAKHAVSGQE
ncbi:MAG: hypothetical protein ABGY96_06990 [bacterium]|nr:hypothetical protein [Gammaproteobacteria bacterium]HIL98768.1 hypothetical protein [Pseudomonadales bacterium]